MGMPDFIKKKIDAKAGKDAADASESESPSDEAEVPAKKGGKPNPLKMWAQKNK